MTWPGEGLLIKLWETLVEKGIGGLLKPWQMRREGVAQIELRRDELLALAAAECLADEIRAGRRPPDDVAKVLKDVRAEALALPASVPEGAPPLLQIASRVAIADAVRAEVNVARAVAAAEEELRSDTSDVPSGSIDSDWIHRWREFAGGVSATELQTLWGRILAGELKSPGAFGLRTLDFVRSLSTDEALKIASLSRFVIDSFVARSQASLLDSSGISYKDMLELQNLGLLSGVEALGLSIGYKSDSPEKFVKALCSHNKVLIAKADDPKKELKIQVYGITRLGLQVMSLGKFEADVDYLRAVGAEIKASGFAVDLADFVQVDASRIRFFNSCPI